MQNNTTIQSSFSKGKLHVKNRLYKAAMSEALGTESYDPSAALIHLYERWARGGAGILLTGNVMVDRTALGEPRNVVLDEKSNLALFKQWANAATQHQTHAWMQLNHPGKQALKGVVKEAVAPSAVPFEGGMQRFFPEPRAMTEDEITTLIGQFGTSARLAEEAGFTGVQIHAAHGYLISQFLSPRHNKREDQWGGPIENRMRLLLEIHREIKQQTSDSFICSVKLNAADFLYAGFTAEEAIDVAHALEKDGIDHLEISGGTYESPAMTGKDSTSKREAYFLDFAEQLKQSFTAPLTVTGGFKTVAGMNDALAGATDFVGIARAFALDPLIAHKLLFNEIEEVALAPAKTHIPAVDQSGMVDMLAYGYYMRQIGKGRDSRKSSSAYRILVSSLFKNGTEIFQKRRVKG